MKAKFDVESHEYNGRWYTDLKAWKIDAIGAGATEQPSYSACAPSSRPTSGTPLATSLQAGEDDNLPF